MDARSAGRRLLNRVRRVPDHVEGSIGAMRVVVPATQRGTYFAQDYEPGVAAALRSAIRPGDVCADVGAHIGWFTLLMAEASGPTGRVVAFEVDGDNVRAIRSNVALNGLEDRVTVEELAVSDRSGAATLWEGRRKSGMEFTLSADFADREGNASGRSRTVRTTSLDEYFPPGARLDVVKMDIEGAEAQALPGMSRLLRESRPVIVLEFHREVGWPGILAILKEDYQFFSLSGESLPVPESSNDVPYQSMIRFA